ncbi:hypothetical protein GGI25_000851 [Coemansia spiralis]|uniref:MoaB/Mog domain-containing protein n=1 Tax=Coemansia spiralis TaxID=417178 RepID=A0A9W8L039_9FUNG|nr:hypothetical protein GGI25_000851 [Coemansia spiralis]
MSGCRWIWCRQALLPTAATDAASRCRVLRRALSTAAVSLHTQPSHSLKAAFCVIGDEILNGKVLDVNSHLFAKRCFELGVEVDKIEVVPDTYDAISLSVRQLSRSHDVVFTSGGLGPTHDDITYSAVAKAFGRELQYSQETLERMRRIMKDRGIQHLPDPHGSPEQVACARMALFPAGSQLAYPCGELWVPVVRVEQNIHIFPGIPKLFERLVDAYLPKLVTNLSKTSILAFSRVLVGTWARESVIAPVLTRLQERYGRYGIRLGSYPTWTPEDQHDSNSRSKASRAMVVLSVVGKDKARVESCRLELCKLLGGFDIPPE